MTGLFRWFRGGSAIAQDATKAWAVIWVQNVWGEENVPENAPS